MSVFGLKLLVCLASFAIGVEDPNSNAASTGMLETAKKAEQLQQQVRLLQDSAMEPNSTLQSDSLRSLINQIQTLKLPFEPVKAGQSSAGKMASPAATPMTFHTSSNKVNANVSLLTEIDTVTDPVNALAAADALYRMGDYARAIRFYDMIIGQQSDSNILPRQWAMYQAANCMRHQDSEKAMELYNNLIAEYPNNAWAVAAAAQKQSLEWLKKNEAELKKRTDVNDPNGR